MEKVLKVDVTDGENVEFTYLEILKEKVVFTHPIVIDMYEFIVMQKMLKVLLLIRIVCYTLYLWMAAFR